MSDGEMPPMLVFDLSVYTQPKERAAMRAALGTGAGVLDLMVKEIEALHRKRGRLTKKGEALANIAQRCADKLWDMRKSVSVPESRHE